MGDVQVFWRGRCGWCKVYGGYTCNCMEGGLGGKFSTWVRCKGSGDPYSRFRQPGRPRTVYDEAPSEAFRPGDCLFKRGGRA